MEKRDGYEFTGRRVWKKLQRNRKYSFFFPRKRTVNEWQMTGLHSKMPKQYEISHASKLQSSKLLPKQYCIQINDNLGSVNSLQLTWSGCCFPCTVKSKGSKTPGSHYSCPFGDDVYDLKLKVITTDFLDICYHYPNQRMSTIPL